MRHGSLFSGIGGFDLAAQWMGWTNVFHCEWNEFGQRVLKHYWPNAISYGDITKTDFTVHRGDIDILTGGFPCQPYSMAGKRKGKEDERHLWPEMLRVIREIKPTWVVGENVFGITNWDGGVVFNEVQADLEAEGYEVQPYVLPACAVNAPHRRDRVWFVAHTDISGTEQQLRTNGNGEEKDERRAEQSQSELRENGGSSPDTPELRCGERCRKYDHFGEWKVCENKQDNGDKVWSKFKNGCQYGTSPNSDSNGNRRHELQYGESCEAGQGRQDSQTACHKHTSRRSDWQDFPTVSPLCDRNDGLSDRLADITFSKWRNESIKAMGNAIVPQVAYQIFKAIEQFNKLR